MRFHRAGSFIPGFLGDFSKEICYNSVRLTNGEAFRIMSNIGGNRNPMIDQLFQGILSLQDIDECYQFFSDLFTVQEMAAFAQRFQVAKLLSEGSTYDGVREQVNTSSSTITRINTELRYGSGGYQMVLDRLVDEEAPPDHQQELKNWPFV